jgi:CNT family concentrative nucleoside transporter
MGIVSIIVILSVAFLFSSHKKKVSPFLVLKALAMQFLLAFFILKTYPGEYIFVSISNGFKHLYGFANQGASFVFGNLANPEGAWGFVFAIKVVPIIIFFGALMSLLYHLRIVQVFVRGIALIIRPILGTSGAETLAVAANSMMGQTEAPLLIKNYLPKITRSELLTIMTSGMCHLSGSLLAVYGAMGIPILHLLSASIMAIPGAILISKIIIPETETPETSAGDKHSHKPETKNILDALSSGTSDGLRLAVNVAAMLIAFISVMALIDYILFAVTGMFMAEGLTLNYVFGKLFYVVAILIGIDEPDRALAGALLGKKLVINEFVAYGEMVKHHMTERSTAIMAYALAGFSNFAAIGIQIGGIGAICPEKREQLTQLGMRALLGGTLANLLNATIASFFI